MPVSQAHAFELDARLAADTIHIGDLALCQVRLMNDARYPWLVLVPRRVAVVEILDLDDTEAAVLLEEIRTCARALRDTLQPHKLNVAALGNVVAQLHVHVIARFREDDAWPQPVWGVHAPRRYAATDVEALRARLTGALRLHFG
jgi:diadenosine tetraphosphate (Ap4A) HIT family hydrolase